MKPSDKMTDSELLDWADRYSWVKLWSMLNQTNCMIQPTMRKVLREAATQERMSIALARRATGQGFGLIRQGMRDANTNDPMLGAFYAHADSLAVHVTGDRHEWNLQHAQQMLIDWEET